MFEISLNITFFYIGVSGDDLGDRLSYDWVMLQDELPIEMFY